MVGSESYIQVRQDSDGKKLRTVKDTVGANEVHNEVMSISDGVNLQRMLVIDANGKLSVANIPTDPAKESGKLTTIDSTLTAIKSTDGIKKITDAVPLTEPLIIGARGKTTLMNAMDVGNIGTGSNSLLIYTVTTGKKFYLAYTLLSVFNYTGVAATGFGAIALASGNPTVTNLLHRVNVPPVASFISTVVATPAIPLPFPAGTTFYVTVYSDVATNNSIIASALIVGWEE